MGTLWEKLTKTKVTPPPPPAPVKPEFQLKYNPLKLERGQGVRIDTLDTDGLDFNVTNVREVRRKLDGESYPIVDYDLLARPIGKPEVRKRLRLVPVEDADKGHDYDAILLNFVDKFPYDKGYHDGLAFDQNQGEAQEGDDKFWRVNDVHDSWTATTFTVLPGHSTPKQGRLEYWDFWRKTKDADERDVTEFYDVDLEEPHQHNLRSVYTFYSKEKP
jgi:hypothetical protein